MIPVKGPKDLKVGDLVEFKVGNAHREGRMRGEVTRVRDDSATLRSDGKSRVVRFFKKKQGSNFQRSSYYDYLMCKMEPIDLWRERRPVTPHVRDEIGSMVPSCTIAYEELQDHTEKVIEELRALAAWLKEKP